MPLEFWIPIAFIPQNERPATTDRCVRIYIPDQCGCSPPVVNEPLLHQSPPAGPNEGSYFNKMCYNCFKSYALCWKNRINNTATCNDCQSEKCDCNEEIWNMRVQHISGSLHWNWEKDVTRKYIADYAGNPKNNNNDYTRGPIQRRSEQEFNFTETIEAWTARVRGAKQQLSPPKIREEKPCVVRTCGRMNDVGVKVCWACGNDQY